MPPSAITSRHNPLVARFKAAARGDDDDRMLLDGVHLIAEALDAGVALDCVAIEGERIDERERAAIVRRVPDDRLVRVSRAVLDAISPVRTPTGIVALAIRPRRAVANLLHPAAGLIVGAADVQDPGNLGALIRAAEAGGAAGVITTRHGADPFGWKALRGAMGSAFRLPLARADSTSALIDDARAAGWQVVAAVGHGHTAMPDVDFTQPTLLVVGNEGQGLSPSDTAAADVRVSIPMQPPVESLNVAVATALLVYEARRQRQSQSRRREGAKAR